MKITSFTMGGLLADIPKPHVRMFPGKKRRKVRCKISSFIGLCPDAKHFYVSLQEEDNPILNLKDETWQSAWDDPEAKGKSFGHYDEGVGEFLTEEDAQKAIVAIFNREFSTKTHVMVIDGYSRKPKWAYKVGD